MIRPIVLLFLVAVGWVHATPIVPNSDDEVIETLHARGLDLRQD